MEYKQLKYFLAVSEELSFSAAASKMFISQQGISKSIAKLEEEIGTELFQRTPNGLKLTPHGEELRYHAQKQLRQMDQIIHLVRNADIPQNSLRIGFEIGTMELLPYDLLIRFMKEHPDDDIRIISYNELQCERMIANQEIDLGFTLSEVENSLCKSALSRRFPIRLLVSRKHPFAQRSSIKLAELRGERLCDLNILTKSHKILRLRCQELGIEPQILINGSEGGFLLNFCRNNLGVGFFAGPKNWLPDDVTIVDIEDISIEWGVELLISREGGLSSLAQQFLDYALTMLGTLE